MICVSTPFVYTCAESECIALASALGPASFNHRETIGMRWLYLLIGLGAMTVAFFVPQIWVLLLLIVVSLVFILLAAHAWYVERVGTQNHDL